MPTYEYLCRQCGDRLEVVQSFADDSLTRHDACGGSLRKVFHARGVVFKGSGFYTTDSRKPIPATMGANGKTASEPKGDRSGDTRSDSKSESDKSSVSSSTSESSASE